MLIKIDKLRAVNLGFVDLMAIKENQLCFFVGDEEISASFQDQDAAGFALAQILLAAGNGERMIDLTEVSK